MVPSASDDGLPAVVARDVNKAFRIPQQQVHTLKERALHPRRRIGYKTFQALDSVSFAVKRGEFFGIAGRNGSGKSTLLKCIAGIYRCDGDIWCRGRLSTFIELGVGFNQELAAEDNVVMNGIMVGLPPREARKRVDRVIEFAGLEEFRDLKLKNYSSGMRVRLAFSVAIQVDADIMLIDEVLAVGDAAFQQKCFGVFGSMREQGKTIIFVTHDMAALKRFCDRALLLDRGSMVRLGDPAEIADRYLELNFGRDRLTPEAADTDDWVGDAKVLAVWIEDDQGERRMTMPQNRETTLHAVIAYGRDVEDARISIYIHNEDQQAVLVLSSVLDFEHVRFSAGERAHFSFTFHNVLAPGRYSPVVNLADGLTPLDALDGYSSAFAFMVTGTQALGGVVDVPTRVSLSRVDPVAAGGGSDEY